MGASYRTGGWVCVNVVHRETAQTDLPANNEQCVTAPDAGDAADVAAFPASRTHSVRPSPLLESQPKRRRSARVQQQQQQRHDLALAPIAQS